MTEKGIRTRNHFIETSAALFNRYGYAGTSIDAILTNAGYSKGALYRTFQDKEEIIVEAFKFNLRELQLKMLSKVDQQTTAKGKMNAMFQFYTDVVQGTIFPGGCPILNTAVEVDDTHEQMRLLTAKAFSSWENLIREILDEGIQKKEFTQPIDLKIMPNFIIAAIEGSIALAKTRKQSKMVLDNIKMLKNILLL